MLQKRDLHPMDFVVPFSAASNLDTGGHTFTSGNFSSAVVFDYDHDGRQDLIIRSSVTSCSPDQLCIDFQYVLRSTGNGFQVIVDPTLVANMHLRRADITGEGNSALIGIPTFSPPDAQITIFRNGLDTPDLLTSIDDGLQGQAPGQAGYAPSVRIRYRPLVKILFDPTDEKAFLVPTYDPSICSDPGRCVAGPKRVVSSYALNSGDDVTGYRMAYRNAAFDVARGEWLGFETIQAFDADENGQPLKIAGTARTDVGVNVKVFDNKTFEPTTKRYPFANVPIYEYRTVGNVLDEVGNSENCETMGVRFTPQQFVQNWPTGTQTYSIFNSKRRDLWATGGSCFPHASQPVFLFSFTAASQLDVLTTYEPDSFGNVKKSTTIAGTHTTQADYTYLNDVQNWLVSQPLTSKLCEVALPVVAQDCRFNEYSYFAATNLVRAETI